MVKPIKNKQVEIIKAEDLPTVFSRSDIRILAKMATHFPVLEEWRKISKILTEEQSVLINNEISKIHIEQKTAKEALKTTEQKAAEKAWWETYYADPNPYKFYGNMGQPETAQEFKNRYGVWPPNYKPSEKEK